LSRARAGAAKARRAVQKTAGFAGAALGSFDRDGWLIGVRHLRSPNFDARPADVEIDLLVIHCISLPPGSYGGAMIEQFFGPDSRAGRALSLNGAFTGTSANAYRQGAGLALETQHYPDSPNHPDFPTTTLNPSQIYHQTTVFQLGTG